MSMEDRMTHAETEVRNLDVCISLLTGLAERQQLTAEENKADIATLTGIAERQLELIQRLDRRQEQLEQQQQEGQRDVVLYRRFLFHLAEKYGWMDDEDWPPPEA